MDKTELVSKVSNLFRISGCKVDISVKINHREIDIRAEETQGLVRKIILVECASYAEPVGVSKIQNDITKLRSAKEVLKDNAIIMHVSKTGYSPEASGYALDNGISIFSFDELKSQLINFDSYIKAIEDEPLRQTIIKEYQQNQIHFERNKKSSRFSLKFLKNWLHGGERWLTLLGDYGVGKSWTLKRFLYQLIEEFKNYPNETPLPFFVPLQKFTKAFDFENLILRSFQMYGLSGVHYKAFEYLMQQGQILFLLDSFDEMAQHLSRDTIRLNLNEILVGVSHNSRAIMTSRPNYFEGRAERLLLVETEDGIKWHQLDRESYKYHNLLSKSISDRLKNTQFARINDLSIEQRKRLFSIVLGPTSAAYKKLMELFAKFEELDEISHRAVIARLLTTVAETLSTAQQVRTIEGYPLLPDDLNILNQAKIFEIVVYNLLYRDQNIGTLSTSDRLIFLRNFAIYLQQRDREFFAAPNEIRDLVKDLFEGYLKRTDSPELLLDGYYRTCRRHSGLTTEGQFGDTSGKIDMPVDEVDTESRVGFSHNSLREYLVADSLVDYIKNETNYPFLKSVVISDLIGDFVVWKSEYDKNIINNLQGKYIECNESNLLEIFFKIIYRFIQKDPQKNITLLGKPPTIRDIDLSGIDMSGLPLRYCNFINCIAGDTDFRKADITQAKFIGTILENIMFDDTVLNDTDFTKAEILSIYVFDKFNTKTLGIIKGKDARQWLFSNGAKVSPSDDLNPLMGQPWYEAAREVTRTLERRIAGTHQDISLSKGTHSGYRTFAKAFVDYLISKGILQKVVKSKTGPGWVVLVKTEYRELITEFSKSGIIMPEIESFFNRYLGERIKQ